MTYLLKGVTPNLLEFLKREIPLAFEYGRGTYKGEKIFVDNFDEIRKESRLKRLIVDDCEYSIKYNRRKDMLGIFIRRNERQMLVKNDESLSKKERGIVERIYIILHNHLITARLTCSFDWKTEFDPDDFIS